MSIRRVLRNMSVAAAAQVVALVVSILISLLVPKVLDVTQFGYWQLFLFYFNFAGVFQFGLNDGVYLLKGGEQRKNLVKCEISSQVLFGLAFQSLIAVIIMVIAIVSQPEESRLFVIFACAILMPFYNVACFFQYLFQAIDETRLYSKSIILERAVMLVLLVVLLAMHVEGFEFYVYSFAFSLGFQLVYLLTKARGIVDYKTAKIKTALNASWSSISVGIKLMLANFASTLILGMMRFFVDGCWGIEVFSQVSLALSMTNFFLTFINQVAMVLFPTLRKMRSEHLKSFFRSVQNALGLLLPSFLLMYLPIKALLSLWLPDYSISFTYLGLLLPFCLFDGKMNALYSTMFKVNRMESTLLILNVGAMVLSAVLCSISAMALHDINALLISGVIAVLVRSVTAELILNISILRKPSVRIGDIFLTVLFVFASLTLPDLSASILYLVAYLGYLLLLRKEAVRLCLDIRSARKSIDEEKAGNAEF